jgi:pyruvate-ferredoxin/flavodoxin oxidoreductase
VLERTDPARAEQLGELLQADADERWRFYEQLSAVQRTVPSVHGAPGPPTVGTQPSGDLEEAW